jgi:type I site-specific restriction endonuclease
MIATGTDVKPLECLLFMRDVKSRNYFEQMKGRGTRTLDLDDLKKVTPSAKSAKTHYVIVDAIGVTKSLKTASQPLITKPGVPLKDLAMGILMGASDEDSVSSLAGRLARLNKQLDTDDQRRCAKRPAASNSAIWSANSSTPSTPTTSKPAPSIWPVCQSATTPATAARKRPATTGQRSRQR